MSSDNETRMIFSNNIKRYAAERHLQQTDIANICKVSTSAVNSWFLGQKIPRMDKIKMLADFFGISVSDLVEKRLDPKEAIKQQLPPNCFPIAKRKYPLLGKIACGQPIFAEEDRESYIMSGMDIDADFCLQASGDSMIGARIMDGDIVFIRSQSMVDNGEIAAVIIDDEATLKRVYYTPGEKIILMSENPKYPPLVYIGEELDTIHILGKAVAFQSDVK